MVVSLTQSATGLAFAAFMRPDIVQDAIDRELATRGLVGQADPDGLAAKLAEARQHGIARAVGAGPSARHKVTVNAFSAPVFDTNGEMVLSLSTTCPAERLGTDWDGSVPVALRRTAEQLSNRLGYRGGDCRQGAQGQ